MYNVVHTLFTLMPFFVETYWTYLCIHSSKWPNFIFFIFFVVLFEEKVTSPKIIRKFYVTLFPKFYECSALN